MKIAFGTSIKDLDGQDIKDGEGALTLATVCCNALLTPDGKDESGIEKVKRFKLAMRIHEGGEQNLSAEDISTVKSVVGKLFPPLVVGRAFEILDAE